MNACSSALRVRAVRRSVVGVVLRVAMRHATPSRDRREAACMMGMCWSSDAPIGHVLSQEQAHDILDSRPVERVGARRASDAGAGAASSAPLQPRRPACHRARLPPLRRRARRPRPRDRAGRAMQHRHREPCGVDARAHRRVELPARLPVELHALHRGRALLHVRRHHLLGQHRPGWCSASRKKRCSRRQATMRKTRR